MRSQDGADGGTRTHTPFREADFLTTSACAADRPDSASVRGLDCPFTLDAFLSVLRCRPSSLYTFRDRNFLSGLARDWHMSPSDHAFPDFERFCSGRFPPGTPIEVCCVYQFRHVRKPAGSPRLGRTLTDFRLRGLPLGPFGRWRLGSESNRRTRLCRPLHDHSAT